MANPALDIWKAPIAKIELTRRVLFRNQETRRLKKKTLQIIIFQRRLFVQLDDRRFFLSL
jgi:hypothetical protein